MLRPGKARKRPPVAAPKGRSRPKLTRKNVTIIAVATAITSVLADKAVIILTKLFQSKGM
jgi:hypothetical protein